MRLLPTIRPTNKKSIKISEMADVSRDVTTVFRGGLRAGWSSLSRRFWPGKPSYTGTRVFFDNARQLYRNDGPSTNLGAGFSRQIVDASVSFIGLPRASSDDEIRDDYLNDAIQNHWAPQIQEMLRNAIRDSVTIVRFRRADALRNPLVTEDESEAGYLEILNPEQCNIFYDEEDPTIMSQAIVTHEVEVIVKRERRGDDFEMPETETHTIHEIITPDDYTYWDETISEWLEEKRRTNPWGFIPLCEVFNDWDSTLQGGQSDLESSYPFIRAFHDVLGQALMAHKAHSVPKAKFQINEIEPFMANNFPDSFTLDEQGNPIPGTFDGEISWKGLEIIFLQPDEDVGFLEAQSVLGDSRELLAFLLECIVIASETPKAIFMMDVGAADRNEMLAFVKKIERKRGTYQQYFQKICKMALVATRQRPVNVEFWWEEITEEVLVNKMQALQQLAMALEVVAERQLVSDITAQKILARFLPMKNPTDEKRDAKKNMMLSTIGLGAGDGPSPNGATRRVTANAGGKNE